MPYIKDKKTGLNHWETTGPVMKAKAPIKLQMVHDDVADIDPSQQAVAQAVAEMDATWKNPIPPSMSMFGVVKGTTAALGGTATGAVSWGPEGLESSSLHHQIAGRGNRSLRPHALRHLQDYTNSYDVLRGHSTTTLCQTITPDLLITLMSTFAEMQMLQAKLEAKHLAEQQIAFLRAKLTLTEDLATRAEIQRDEARAELDRRRVTVTQVVFEGRKFNDDL